MGDYSNKEEKTIIRLAASLIIFQKQLDKDGYEILMMKRADTTSFKSATVFPGGALDKVDDLDYWKEFEFVKKIKTDEDKKQTSLKLTAIRETFEEAGILITKPQLSLADSEVKEWREKLEENSANFIELCKYYKVNPDVDSLYYVSHWMPPKMIKKKFSTYFFAYLSPNPVNFHLPNTAGSQRELTGLEYNTPDNWIKLQLEEIIFFPPQFYLCSILAQSFPTWDSIELHMNTIPTSSYESMIPQFQAIDDTQVNLPELGINPRSCDAILYHIYPGDFQYNKNLSKVDYGPISGTRSLNVNVKYHRILCVAEGGHLRSIKLITNLKPFDGRYLAYEDANSKSVTKL
ncbi:hypothetical protein CONCODRAFT_17224 [Conidiobolus coronatus NRRL 28638]|uniref:Nudix hydrolase domain-containing protein n=1 Tax=Conidiobolus coronatus (strain ATCC 28846 / CBS 209.66 / NRRL 28638) TaxID=796925 RepID=A0A137P7G8_CONC2|nr:hypothetical protein CONCODRAFT_17224 [Conidiobolus coronatus NRRL 28638]|eukprot:KXN70950.1 hypothetical protein CONCODRAFT_17224 [Conidiobolus coronatus NRRL 28638]